MRKQKVPELIEFVHAKYEKRGTKNIGVGPHIGCVIARRVRSRDSFGRFMPAIGIGWSKVNVSAGDSFDKNAAIKIARERAILGNAPSMPKQIAPVHERMEERAARYFQFTNWA